MRDDAASGDRVLHESVYPGEELMRGNKEPGTGGGSLCEPGMDGKLGNKESGTGGGSLCEPEMDGKRENAKWKEQI